MIIKSKMSFSKILLRKNKDKNKKLIKKCNKINK